MKKRDNGLDLLRIICMLMVVGLHTMDWGDLIEGTLIPQSANWYVGNTVYTLFLQAVNCFVLISGYFLCTSQFRLRKLLSVWVQAAFYSVVVYIVVTFVGEGMTCSIKGVIKSLLVVTMDRYWFVTDYILMLCLSPFLNCLIRAMDRKTHLVCCGVLVLIFCVIPNFVYIVDFSAINGGYSWAWFCVLYMIAAYIRLYVPKQVRHQKWMFSAYVLLAMVICGERFLAHWITPYIFGGVRLSSFFYSYNSVIALPCALALFQTCRGLELKEGKWTKLIAVLSPLTFAVYLIHDHPHLRPFLWEWLKPGAMAQSVWMLPYCLLCIVGIFAVCCGIEWLRQRIFHLCRIDRAISTVSDRIQGWVAAKVEKLPLD